ncbi:MAG TPA: hypothetical protein V6C97_04470, partial [Oculatellaceae cyanobacterium]
QTSKIDTNRRRHGKTENSHDKHSKTWMFLIHIGLLNQEEKQTNKKKPNKEQSKSNNKGPNPHV